MMALLARITIPGISHIQYSCRNPSHCVARNIMKFSVLRFKKKQCQ